MSEIGYPRSASEVVATLGELFINQQKPELAELLESAVAYIEQTDYDNWNGGTYTWALRLEIPVSIYAKFESSLEAVESQISKKLGLLDRIYPRDHLSEVTILPITSATAALGKKVAPSGLDIHRLWGDGKFKLFLSHVSAHKVTVGKLSTALSIYGVSAFVAHDDMVSAFAAVITYEQAKLVSKILVQLADFTDEEKSAIWKAYEDNGQIKDSYGVREALVRAIGNQPIKKVVPVEDDIPF